MRQWLARSSWVAAVAGAVLGATACGGGDDAIISRVFEAPPWTGAERLSYNLVQRGGHVYGTCSVETIPQSGSGQTELKLLCTDGAGHHDDRSATVDSQTLRPFSATRVISDDAKGKRTSFTSQYEADIVRLEANVDGKVNKTERDLPQPTDKSPEPGYYDDESLLWVVRGIPLRTGWEGAYKDVNAGNGRIFTVAVKVEGPERVTVPAGGFNTWRVRIRTNSVTQYFWIDDAAPHRIVRARIERLTYELTGIE